MRYRVRFWIHNIRVDGGGGCVVLGFVLIFDGKVDGGGGEVVNESGSDMLAIAGSIDVMGVAKEGGEVANEVVGQSGVGRLGLRYMCVV